MALTQITNHADRAVARLLYQYRGKQKLEDLVRIFCAGDVQELEDAAFGLLAALVVATSSGATLDRLGAIVGQAREGRTDSVFKVWILARVKLNKSSGTIPELLEIFQAVGPAGARFVYTPAYPAGFELTIADVATTAADAEQLRRLLGLATAGGVGSWLKWSAVVPSETFSFSGGAGKGFGGTGSPAGTGGKLSSIRRAS